MGRLHVCSNVFFIVCLGLFIAPFVCFGLESKKVFVVANKNADNSIILATYYMKKRGIPKSNLITIAAGTGEKCSRSDFIVDIAIPLRTFLMERKQNAPESCLVLMHGIPLKIVDSSVEKIRRRVAQVNYDSTASVDSEIAAVYEFDYPLSGWIFNPLCRTGAKQSVFIDQKSVFMVSRLDGPTSESVKRIIDESVEVEQRGLGGRAYFDARWMEASVGDDAYRGFDMYIHEAARLTKQKTRMPVVLNSSEDLFVKGGCPNAGLYCGWYSLGKYVDAFQWVRGAVGYHVASSECTTLRKTESTVWCKMMIEKGAAATLGPVGEPYLQAFPQPDVFFGYLFQGDCLAEAYMKSIPHLSWKMVLVGDPLYRPFKRAVSR